MLTERVENTIQFLKKVINDEMFDIDFIPNQSEILIEIEADAAMLGSEQEVQALKGRSYKYWTHLLEGNSNSRELGKLKMSDAFTKKEYYSVDERYDDENIQGLLISHFQNHHRNHQLESLLVTEFYYVYRSLVFFDDLNFLHEKFLDIFRRGGMPCGWKGEFPQGKILVFPLS